MNFCRLFFAFTCLAGGAFASAGYAEESLASVHLGEESIRQSFDELFAEADRDYIAFWERCARELVWNKPWDKALVWTPPEARWFEGGLINVSYNCLDRHIAEGHGDKIALIHIDELGHKRSLSYRELYLEVNKIANVMKQLGIKRGDRVAIYMPMVPEALASMLACTRLGAVHTVIFGGIGPLSVQERICDAEAKLLITVDGSYRGGKVIKYKTPIDPYLDNIDCLKNVLVFQNIGLSLPLKEGRDIWYSQIVNKSISYCPPEAMNAEDPLFILYTSGTTGKPKGILHTTGGYLVGVHSTYKWVFGIQPDDIYWCTADIGWITGHSYVVYGPMSHCATQVIYEGAFNKPQKNRFARIIDDEKVTIFYTAPTLVRMFMQWGDECLKNSSLSSLRLLGSIGEPINPESWNWFHEKIGHKNCPIVDTWFQTETGAFVLSPLPGYRPLKPGSVTKPLPGYSVAILDEEGHETDKGYLAILRPYPSMMRGVYKNKERYISTYWSKWDGKYYFAGDVALKDREEDIWVGGRCDEVLKVAGHRIGTAEVENALIECSEVAESAVVGIKDNIKGQRIVAFVVLKDDFLPDEALIQKLLESVSAHVGGYAKPARIVFVNHLPKTRSGKILRRVLKNLVEGEDVGNTATLSDPGVVDALKCHCEKLRDEFFGLKATERKDLTYQDLLSLISPMPNLQNDTPEPVTVKGAVVASVVEPFLRLHLQETNYDRLHLVEQFIDYYVAESALKPYLKPIEALAQFQPYIGSDRYHGSTCHGLTEDLYSRLPRGLQGYRIGATLPVRFQQNGWPLLCHVALAIPYVEENGEEGVVLLDPNFDIEVAIVLKKEGPPVLVDMKDKGFWTFQLSNDKIFCKTSSDDKEPSMVYELKNYLNASEVGTKPMIAMDRRISLLSRGADGRHKAHLNVNFHTDSITSSIYEMRQEPIGFEAFLAGSQFSETFAQLLGLSADSLNRTIVKVIKNKALLDRLYGEYLALLAADQRKDFFVNKVL